MTLDGILGNLAGVLEDPVFVVEADGNGRRVVFVNEAVEQVLGYPRSTWDDRLPRDITLGKHAPDAFDRLSRATSRGENGQEQLVLRHADGRELWMDVRVTHITSKSRDDVSWMITVLRDISRFKSLERRLEDAAEEVGTLREKLSQSEEAERRAAARLADAVEAMPSALVVFDPEDRLVVWNEAYREICHGIEHLLTPGRPYEELLRAGVDAGHFPESQGREEAWIAERLAQHREVSADFEQLRGDGRYVRVMEMRTLAGDYIGCRIDVTELKSKEREAARYAAELEAANTKMRHFAMHDSLTGLGNRRALDDALSALASRGTKEEDRPEVIGFLHIDLDNFKQINDTMGHAAGDAALVWAADRLRGIARDDDRLFRMGGDEFAVLAAGDALTRDTLEAMGTRIVRALAEPFSHENHALRVGASVGVSLQDARSLDPAELVSTSDIALYDAKRRGRGQVRIFSVDLKRRLRKTRRLSDDILAALESDQFFAVYQPQVDARSRRFVGVEALCRWDHPTRGIVAPDTFLPTARDLKVLAEIDERVYRRAAADIERLMSRGRRVPRISFNVEQDRLMADTLLPSLRRIAALGTRVAVELIENMSLDDPDDPLMWAIDSLREAGIAVEIDDFGSCRASLLGVLNVRPDAVKIDRALVNSVIGIRAQRDIIRALVNLANTLGIRVTAEGVESDCHADMLTTLGCHTLQGYAIARPMSAEGLEMYLESQAEEDRAFPPRASADRRKRHDKRANG